MDEEGASQSGNHRAISSEQQSPAAALVMPLSCCTDVFSYQYGILFCLANTGYCWPSAPISKCFYECSSLTAGLPL